MKGKYKEIKAYQYKSLIHKERQQQRNKGTTKHLENNKMALVLNSTIKRHRAANG